MNIISLIIGDRSGDGHGKHEKIVIVSNLSNKEIEAAYKKGVKKIGFDLLEECSDFEDNTISFDKIEKMNKLGFDYKLEYVDDDYGEDDKFAHVYSEEWKQMYLFFVKAGNPDFNFVEIDPSSDIHIGGYGLFE